MAGPRVVFFFNHRTADDLAAIRAGRLPTERLYGLVELQDRGWDAVACDARLDGRIVPRLSGQLRRVGLDAIGPWTIAAIADADVLVVKDDLSPSLSLAARAMGKPLLYLDSLFDRPRRVLARTMLRANVALAPRILSYSRYQVDYWCRECEVPAEKFAVLPYTLDLSFYRPLPPSASSAGGSPYVMAAGRDLGRDFAILVDAAAQAGVGVKLVTLPYLVPEAARGAAHVEILQRLAYAELFALYRDALGVAVPLKPSIIYPSGIRGMLEGLALGRATLATRTPILEEYVSDADEVVTYVAPDDREGWVRALTRLRDDAAHRAAQERAGPLLARARFGMPAFVDPLERELRAALGGTA